MKKIPVIKTTSEEVFLEINTFECALGRVTPEFCEKVRSRKPVEIGLRDNHKRFLKDTRPIPCILCQDFEVLAKQVYKKRQEFLKYLKGLIQKEIQKRDVEEKKTGEKAKDKHRQCKNCGEIKRIVAKGLCKACYNRQYVTMIQCSVCGQIKPVYVKSLQICSACYRKLKRRQKKNEKN